MNCLESRERTWSDRLNAVSVLAFASSLAMVLLLSWMWDEVNFTYQQPSLWIALTCLVILAVHQIRLDAFSWRVQLFWLAGALTLLWSTAPGNSTVYLIWGLGFISSFLVGLRTPVLILPLNVILLAYGYWAALPLNLFELQRYTSGSVHYVVGAQSLLVLPIALFNLLQTKRVSLVTVGWFLLSLLSLYLALISGARAVYLPLTVALVLLVVRCIKKTGPRSILLVGLLIGSLVISIDRVIPNQPLLTAMGKKASVGAQVEAVAEHGGFSQRLRYWDQALAVVLDQPLGAGVGSYQATAHFYQKYPMTWSNSPHNYYLETLATGGWLRLALLLLLLVPPLVRVWFSPDWPWALAVGGFWMTLAFDVTSYYPSFMMLAFMSLGVIYSKLTTLDRQTRPMWQRLVPRALSVATVITGASLAAWWFFPCDGVMCSVDRYLGIDYKVLPALERASPADRLAILHRARQLYPLSSWVVRAEQRYIESPDERLALAREFASRFPYQHPENYLDWANAALAIGRHEEAITAVNAGLEVFPADEYPYGERRMTPERYAQWIEDANAILATASSDREDEVH
ncbi:MAG TPA: O-antigen ligase family protein [Trueperaceae bacterium]